MNRRLASLAAAALLGGSVGLASPASAEPGVCAGSGSAELSGGIGAAVLFDPVTVTFELTLECQGTGGEIFAWGTLDEANCGLSTGSGWLRDQAGDVHAIDIQTAGSLIIATGATAHAVGQATPTRGGCESGTADQFQVTGAGVATA